jgi:phage major head subunit gpT-like protein
MANPMTSGSFADLIDKRVTKLFYDEYKQLPSRLGDLYAMEKSSDSFERWSEVGTLADFAEFQGTVTYQQQSQGYDTIATHIEFANGIQIERKLYDDDRHGIWERRPVALANSASRTREKHGARILNNAFSVDSYFYNNTEGVALCSDSHTTTSGASTAVGFDNKGTAALSAVALAAARVQFVNLRGDQAERISLMPDELWIPPNLYDIAYEITESQGKPDTANNNANVHFGKYKVYEWNYLTDTNDFFLCDSRMRKQWLVWFDRTPLEFAFAEELDNLVAKWRAYMRYSFAWFNWRWIVGNQVS